MAPGQQIRTTLRSSGLAPHKKLGQNFLVHRHTAERIVELAAPAKDDVIVEVGVGLGALTNPIAARAAEVIGIETDSGLVQFHRDQNDLPANVTLIHADILKISLEQLVERSGGPLKIIANLPYSVSSPFLFRLLDHRALVDWAVVMLQKEVALRLTAEPGTREYGIPSVLFAACAAIESLMPVKPEEFHPRPRVDSQVIRIRFRPPPERLAHIPPFDWNMMKKIVHTCFARRRKTLRNGLAAAGLIADRNLLKAVIERAGLSPTIRAEQLSLEQFADLARCMEEYTGKAATGSTGNLNHIST
ncbi:MAG: 16S rRNA (adenine(1518)-N(6)/adenine(1519)-N(6))-dimethyltransferase RsmA [Desulfobulbaceae bacterium]|jgi:16S rRNA (adenine1518-N6/adenine1519-N6)-dimethyltransferase|nr:16S rRNA (adenine(1518)-N(6)/adenine(1519)-N(6))-dimethyltransferase RsmA [Desulfobulbaceae bacterium]